MIPNSFRANHVLADEAFTKVRTNFLNENPNAAYMDTSINFRLDKTGQAKVGSI
jgi:hypothetical protein